MGRISVISEKMLEKNPPPDDEGSGASVVMGASDCDASGSEVDEGAGMIPERIPLRIPPLVLAGASEVTSASEDDEGAGSIPDRMPLRMPPSELEEVASVAVSEVESVVVVVGASVIVGSESETVVDVGSVVRALPTSPTTLVTPPRTPERIPPNPPLDVVVVSASVAVVVAETDVSVAEAEADESVPDVEAEEGEDEEGEEEVPVDVPDVRSVDTGPRRLNKKSPSARGSTQQSLGRGGNGRKRYARTF